MGTQLFLAKTADKAQRRMDKPLRERIRIALLEIGSNPRQKGERLSQPLSMLYSHHLTYQGKEFRIAYQYSEEQDCVYIILIAPHENFYKRVKNLVYAS